MLKPVIAVREGNNGFYADTLAPNFKQTSYKVLGGRGPWATRDYAIADAAAMARYTVEECEVREGSWQQVLRGLKAEALVWIAHTGNRRPMGLKGKWVKTRLKGDSREIAAGLEAEPAEKMCWDRDGSGAQIEEYAVVPSPEQEEDDE